jgi:hypothetical protein
MLLTNRKVGQQVINFMHADFRAEDWVQHRTLADVLVREREQGGTGNANLSHVKPPK